MRYLGGIGLYLLGGFLIFVGIIAMITTQNQSICLIIGGIGFLCIIIGAFYARTSAQRVPTKIEIVEKKSKSDRYCPECGRAIPFDANTCPYCKKDFEE